MQFLYLLKSVWIKREFEYKHKRSIHYLRIKNRMRFFLITYKNIYSFLICFVYIIKPYFKAKIKSKMMFRYKISISCLRLKAFEI